MQAQASLPLVLPQPSAYDVVIGESNRLAYQMLMDETHWHHPVLVLQGETGSGKSALGALWARHHHAVPVSHETIDSLLKHFTPAYYYYDANVIRPEDEAPLLHLFNLVKEQGKRLLITLHAQPASIAWGLADLGSRMKAAGFVAISQPDDMMRELLLTKQCALRQLRIAPEVLDYILLRIPRDYAALYVFMDALDAYALQQQRPITKLLAKDVLDALFPASNA